MYAVGLDKIPTEDTYRRSQDTRTHNCTSEGIRPQTSKLFVINSYSLYCYAPVTNNKALLVCVLWDKKIEKYFNTDLDTDLNIQQILNLLTM